MRYHVGTKGGAMTRGPICWPFARLCGRAVPIRVHSGSTLELAPMSTRVLVVEDDPDISELVARYLDKAGILDHACRIRAGRARRRPQQASGSDRAGLDAAAHRRARSLPVAARRRKNRGDSDHHADRARRRIRTHRRPRDGRRRLPRQALQPQRARRPRAGAASPRPAPGVPLGPSRSPTEQSSSTPTGTPSRSTAGT